MVTLSATISPFTSADWPTVTMVVRISPSTAPSIWMSPSLTRLPTTCRLALMIEGTPDLGEAIGVAMGFSIGLVETGCGLLVVFENIVTCLDEFHRIHGLVVHTNLVMHV